MESTAAVWDAETLLAQRDAVRRLALRLVRDPHQADDIAQDAMLIGLESGRRAQGLSAWLSGVTRNLAARQGRDAVRRRRREHVAFRDESVAPTDEIAARVAEHRKLLDVLESLEQPYRSTLLMRYFEGLAPRQIAKQTDTPLATVKSRLQRGLQQMRAALDASHGGDRRRWIAALMPSIAGLGAKAGAVSLVTGGGVWMGLKAKALVATAAVLLIGGGVFFATRDPEVRDQDQANSSALLVGDDPVAEMADVDAPGVALKGYGPSAQDTAPVVAVEAATGKRFTGRVVDPKRVAVPGATVHLLYEGRELEQAVTDAKGRYRMVADVPEPAQGSYSVRCLARATTSDGRAGYVVAYGSRAKESAVAAIILRPSQAVTVLVRSRTGTPILGATVRAKVRASNWRLELRSHTTDGDGRAVISNLQPGTLGICATAPGYAPGLAGVQLPHKGGELEVVLDPPQTFEATVVERGPDTPVPDADISTTGYAASGMVWSSAEMGWATRTDAQGIAIVPTFSAGTTVYATAKADSHPALRRPRHHEISEQGKVERGAVRLILAPRSTLTWPVANASAEMPPDGMSVVIRDADTVMDVSGHEIPSQGSIRQGELVLPRAVSGRPNATPGRGRGLSLFAILDDGRGALLSMPAGQTRGEPVTFIELRHVDVTVLDADGAPVRDVWVSVNDGPQNLRASQQQTTSAEGTCRIARLVPRVTQLSLAGTFRVAERVIQTVDLRTSDQRVTIRLPRTQRVEVTVMIDGKSGLPESYSLWLKEMRSGLTFDHPHDEDGTTGRVVVLPLTDEELVGMTVGIKADGYPSATSVLEMRDGVPHATLRMDRRDGIEITIRPPSDGVFKLTAEKYAPEYKRWYTQNSAIQSVDATRARVGALAPGLYRVRDRLTSVASGVLEVQAGKGSVHAVLDLSEAGMVTGRIVAPAGTNPAHVRLIVRRAKPVTDGTPPTADVVTIIGVGPTPPKGPMPFREPDDALILRDDGTFSVRVSGKDPIELQAWHPLLHGERTTVTAPQQGLSLTLSSSATASFALPTEPFFVRPDQPAVGRRPIQDAGRRVKLFTGEPKGNPVFVTNPMSRDSRQVFGGFKPGTYTVWIDGGKRPPTIKSGVQLGAGETDLGAVTFSAGSTVRVRFEGDGKRPSIRIRAQSMEDGSIRSTMMATKLTGMPAGRWTLMVRSLASVKILFHEEVEVNGVDDLEVTVHLE